MTPGESMCAYKPRPAKSGMCPHITLVRRKPKPLGMELKTACDGGSGVMLFMEIQEDKEAMAH